MPKTQVKQPYQDWQMLQQVVAALPNAHMRPKTRAFKRQKAGIAAAFVAQEGNGSSDTWQSRRPPRFTSKGPYTFTTLPVLNIPLGPSPSDPTTLLELQLEVLTPQSKSPCPVVVCSAGFLLNSSMYRSYAAKLASWGYTVVLWDLSEVLDDTLTCAFMKQVLDLCGTDARLQKYCSTAQLLLMGHSRGAKLSCLIAAEDPRVRGLVLLDPVDNSSFGPQGVGYPSSLPALSKCAAQRQVPVLVLGAALNTDVVPVEANWRRFVSAAATGGAPVWEVVLQGSSHLQFLDKQLPLFAMFSNNGPTPDEVVREITQACMVAFTQLALCPTSRYSPLQVQTLLAEEAAGLQQLAPLDSSFKNMNQLRTCTPGTAAAADKPVSQYSRAGEGVSAGQSAAAGQSRQQRAKPVQASYSQLMTMRVRELKRLLQEHGVDSSDCFEKDELVRRVLQKCTA
eukprot:gene4918-5161_t